MTVHDDSATHELHALRARAYGPEADIEDDPVAMRRLHELERQVRPEPPGTPLGESATDDAEGAVDARSAEVTAGAVSAEMTDAAALAPIRERSAGEPAPPDDAAQEPASASQGDEPGSAVATQAGGVRSAKPWWRRTATLWIASVVVAAIVAATVTMTLLEATAGRVAVLRLDPDAEWPEGFFGQTGDGLVFEEFHGLVAVVAPQDWAEGEVLDCLFVRAAGGEPRTGGCAGGGFPPTAALIVSATSPDELREQFPEGTALQFVHRGPQVHVYAKEPALFEPTP